MAAVENADACNVALLSLPGHDDPWGPCYGCDGRHWVSLCDRHSLDCCGACDQVECSSCSDGDGMHPFGTALISDEDEQPAQLDALLRPDQFTATGVFEYPHSRMDWWGLYDEAFRGEHPIPF